MTEKLRTLMHERAARPEFALPDVDALVRAGRARARRRTLVTSGAAAVAAMVVVGVAVASQGGDDRATGPADAGLNGSISWAHGSVLHTPHGATDLGHPIEAYVSTPVGHVFTDGAGNVYSAVGGEVERVGGISRSAPHLVSDGDGPLVAWVDPSEGRGRFVSLDLGTGTRTVHEAGGGRIHVFAVDGRTAYVSDPRGALAVDVDSGGTRVVEAEVQDDDTILAVEDGVIAFDAVDEGTAVGTGWDDARVLPDSFSSAGVFSPDARYLSLDADEPHVYDVSTGERLSLDVGGRVFATGFQWLDDHTLVMISAETEDDAADLLTCDVPAGACEVAVPDLGSFDELAEGFALPVGEPLG